MFKKLMLLGFVMYVAFITPRAVAQEQHFADSMMQYYSSGNYQQAIFWGEKNAAALKLQRGEQDTLYGAAISDLGVFYFLSGNYDKAKQLYKQGANIIMLHYGENNLQFATAINNLARLYDVTGEYKMSEDLYLQALKIYKKVAGEENVDYARTTDNLAVLYVRMDNYFKAEKLALKAMEIRKKMLLNDDMEYAISLNTLANIYSALGNYKPAASFFEQAATIAKVKLGDKHPDYATLLGNLASLYIYENELNKAAKFAREDVAIKKETLGENHESYATALINLADIHYRLHQYDSAGSMYKQAAAIQEKTLGERSILYTNTVSKLGQNYAATGNFSTADSIYKAVLQLQKELVGDAHYYYINTLALQADLYRNMHRYKEATEIIRFYNKKQTDNLKDKLDFLTEKELIEFVRTSDKGFSLPYTVLFDYKSPMLVSEAYNFRLLYKGISLENVSNLQSLLEQSTDSSMVNDWKNYKQNKAILANVLAKPINQRLINTDSLNQVANRQEKDLLSRSADYRNIKSKFNVNFAAVRNHLKPGEAAIEFIDVPYSSNQLSRDTVAQYGAMIIRPQDTTPVFVKLCNEKELQTALKKFAYKATYANSINTTILNAATKLPKSLFDLVWLPLEPYLKKVKTVYFSPSGSLNELAFAAIPFKKDSLLFDKYTLVQLTSTRQVAMPDSQTAAPASIALFGAVDYNKQSADTSSIPSSYPYSYVYQQNRSTDEDSFSYLPGSYNEILEIQKKMMLQQKKVLLYSGSNATEAEFRNLSNNKSPEVIHFATHGFVLPPNYINGKNVNTFKISEDPMLRSGLVLAGGNKGWQAKNNYDEDDGILTAMEITAVQLSNTKLAVLSACETGTGEMLGSEGVFGLQRAFKLAGVQYVMASLWQVPDKETAEFMNFFYSSWLGGKTIPEAFNATQKAMRKKYAPYYWAGFTLVK